MQLKKLISFQQQPEYYSRTPMTRGRKADNFKDITGDTVLLTVHDFSRECTHKLLAMPHIEGLPTRSAGTTTGWSAKSSTCTL